MPDAARRLGEVLAVDHPADALQELQRRTGVPRSLGELGMPASDVQEAARAAAPVLATTGVPLEMEEISQLLTDAHAGTP